MNCEDCKKKPATVNFTQIINNQKTVLHLCRSCAEKRGFTMHKGESAHGFGVENLVSKIANEYEEESNAVTCGRCGLKYIDFKHSGRLGCGHCYTAFGDRLDDLLRKIHGSDYHIGKMPRKLEPEIAQSRQVESLRKEMEMAIKREEFEKAAKIRDRIKQLEGEK
jgi:protein arginine kinase activator